jgi:hypothetical protein
MSTKWQRVRVSIPETYTPSERQAIAEQVIEFIRDRVSGKGLDKNNDSFKPYSKAYEKSLNFKIAGKDPGDVNLTLSGDMLGAMTLLSHEKGSLLIGFENGSQENAIADGNIRGTYGKSKANPSRSRNFLGLTNGDLKSILSDFKAEDADISDLARQATGGKNVQSSSEDDNIED